MKSEPFLFDANIFDDDAESSEPLSEEELAKLPEFSREDMEAARQKAYNDGKKDGEQAALESITNTMLTVLQKVETDVNTLFSFEEKRQKDYEENATYLAVQLFSKLFPVYMEEHGLEELRASVLKALSSHMVPENIRIEINGDIFEAFTTLMREHTETLQRQISFKTDPSLPEHACRISWPGGGLLCDRDSLAKKIFDILNHSLAERDFNLHDGGNCDKESTPEEITTSGETTDE